MNQREAEEIIATHKRGACDECFEGECMDGAYGYLKGCKDTLAQLTPVVTELRKTRCYLDGWMISSIRLANRKDAIDNVLRLWDAAQNK